MLEPKYQSHITNKERAKLVGQKLLMLRKQAELSQKEVCDYLETTPQTYSGYETGRHEPSIETMIRLSFFYNVDMDFITGKWDGIDIDKSDSMTFENVIDNPRFQDIVIEMQELKERLARIENKQSKS